MNTIFKTIMLALCMASAVASFAAKDYTKVVEQSFTISNGAKVEIINKFGTIDIRPTDGNEVTFKVEIEVDAKDQDRANEVFDIIDIDFYDTKDYVKVETKIAENNKFWKKLKSRNNSNYEINYYVNVPRHVYLVLKNKYGHIHAGDMDNNMDINLKYGNFDIGTVHDLDVVLGYGDGQASHANEVNIEIKYGKIAIAKTDNIDIESRYAQMSFDDAKDITSLSKYDTYKVKSVRVFRNKGRYDNINLGGVENVIIHSKYTNIEVGKLNSSAEFGTGHGSIRINELSSGFDEIDIESSYTGIKIITESSAAFDYEIETEYADIDVPNNNEIDEDKTKKWVKASKNGGGKGKIKIKSKYGNVKIK